MNKTATTKRIDCRPRFIEVFTCGGFFLDGAGGFFICGKPAL